MSCCRRGVLRMGFFSWTTVTFSRAAAACRSPFAKYSAVAISSVSSGSEFGLDCHGKYGNGTNSSGSGFRLVTASDVGSDRILSSWIARDHPLSPARRRREFSFEEGLSGVRARRGDAASMFTVRNSHRARRRGAESRRARASPSYPLAREETRPAKSDSVR